MLTIGMSRQCLARAQLGEQRDGEHRARQQHERKDARHDQRAATDADPLSKCRDTVKSDEAVTRLIDDLRERLAGGNERVRQAAHDMKKVVSNAEEAHRLETAAIERTID